MVSYTMAKRGQTVFIVDDDPSVRKGLRRLIKSAGLAVETFASAQEFLQGGHTNAPGCLVLDVRMPGLSGPQLQEELNEGGSTLPIIFITAHENSVLREEVMKAGARFFLMKPLHDQRFLDAVHTALSEDSQ